MAKVHNPLFLQDFQDYLLSNGFDEAGSITHEPHTQYFFKDETVVEVVSNRISVSKRYDEEPPQHTAGYAHHTSFAGLEHLDLFNFMLLMHTMGALPLSHFIANAKSDAKGFSKPLLAVVH